MKTSPVGLVFIEKNEGLKLTVYSDNGRPAIGYGHDLTEAEIATGKYAKGITTLDAQMLLEADVDKVEAALNPLIPASCTQNQWDALVDFGYNLGVGSLKTMLGHGWAQVPQQIPRWHHKKVDGVEQEDPRLKARRMAEVALFEGSSQQTVLSSQSQSPEFADN